MTQKKRIQTPQKSTTITANTQTQNMKTRIFAKYLSVFRFIVYVYYVLLLWLSLQSHR